MNRDDFIDLLARLVSDGELTEDEATDLLAQFDDGTLPDTWQLPLPVAEGIRRQPDDHTTEAALALLLLILRDSNRPSLRSFPPRQALGLANAIQAAFEMRVGDLAANYATGSLSLAQWQSAMLTEIEQHITQQMLLGGGSQTLTRAQRQRLQAALTEQSAYLQRFADHAALRQAQGRLWSEQYIASRAVQYAGVGRGEFFRSDEEARMNRGDLGDGWLIDYISRDDRRTCSNCLDAQYRGPYLPGTPHPLPGIVCLARGRCRCRLQYRYSLAEYRRLTGQRAA